MPETASIAFIPSSAMLLSEPARSATAATIISTLTATAATTTDASSLIDEFCQWETFNASCESIGGVVLMTAARYGRMRFGRCVREDHGSVGCNADVLGLMDLKCSGLRSCLVRVPDATLHMNHPCPKELMPYLEASYSCVKAEKWGHHKCSVIEQIGIEPLIKDQNLQPHKLNYYSHIQPYHTTSLKPPSSSKLRNLSKTVQTGGLVINLTESGSQTTYLHGVEESTDVHDITCPWLIQVPSGQKINLTVFTFTNLHLPNLGMENEPEQHSSRHQQHVGSECYIKLTLTEDSNSSISYRSNATSSEKTFQSTFILCRDDARRRTVFESKTNKLIINVKLLKRPMLDRDHSLRQTGSQDESSSSNNYYYYHYSEDAKSSKTDKILRVSQQGGHLQSVSNSANHPMTRFLLYYEATGCPDLFNVANARVIRSGSNLSIKCQYSSDTFYLTCKKDTWIGEVLTCPEGRSGSARSSSLHTYGVLTAIGLGVALLVSCLVVIVFFLVAFFKKKKSGKRADNPIQDPLLKSPVQRFQKAGVNYSSGSDRYYCHYHDQLNQFENMSAISRDQLETSPIALCRAPDCFQQKQVCRSDASECTYGRRYGDVHLQKCDLSLSLHTLQRPNKVVCPTYSGVVDGVLVNCTCNCCDVPATVDVNNRTSQAIYSSFDNMLSQRSVKNSQILSSKCNCIETTERCNELMSQNKFSSESCCCNNASVSDCNNVRAPSVNSQSLNLPLCSETARQNAILASTLATTPQQQQECVSLDLIRDYNQTVNAPQPPRCINETFFSNRTAEKNNYNADRSKTQISASAVTPPANNNVISPITVDPSTASSSVTYKAFVS